MRQGPNLFLSVLPACVLGLMLCAASAAGGNPPAREKRMDPSRPLVTLDQAHPRLMLKQADLKRLRSLHETDEALQRMVRQVIEQADGCLDDAALTYDKRGPRLLHVSRECLRRTYALAFAWRWTGDDAYARKAVDNLLTVCDFPDWNPSHFLDTAEMSHAVGVGYDWLYDYMDSETRERLRRGLLEHGMQPGLNNYEKGGGFVRSYHNWNQVCNGGLTVGALAIADTDPDVAATIVSSAVASLPKALASYAPDGAWMEGPGYWRYATSYTAYGLAAMRSALGTDFGLSESEGLDETGRFPIYSTGPTGRPLSYADCGWQRTRGPAACMFWLARRYDDEVVAADEHDLLEHHRASPEHVMWYVPEPADDKAPRDLDRLFRGRVPVAFLRSGWDSADALFVGVKAGYNQVNHGHLDLGNFEMDALGVRWAVDLGSDDYNMPGYWDMKPGGKRWSYYRLNSHSHNVSLIDDGDQSALGTAEIAGFESQGERALALIDLTKAYEGQAEKVMRGIRLVDSRRAVLVQDEFVLPEPAEVTWGMTTEATISVAEKTRAELTLDGRKLVARALSPDGAFFETESAEQEPPQKRNEGISRLLLRVPEAHGELRVTVLLSPDWPGAGPTESADVVPLAEW